MDRERAHRTFKQLAQDLARVKGHDSNVVLCPLCLGEYSEEALDLDDPELTEEHIIPGSLGGKLRRCHAIAATACMAPNSMHI